MREGAPLDWHPQKSEKSPMKTMFALAAAMFVLSGCAVYDSRGGYYDDGYKKPHPHGCPPGQAKKGNC